MTVTIACWPAISEMGAGSVLALKLPYEPGWQTFGAVVLPQRESNIRTWLN